MAKQNTLPKRFSEILDVAAEIFSEKGFHGASTKDIAERLGIQQAGVYYYFKSKESVLAEVCRIGVQGYVEHAAAIAKSDAPTTVKLQFLFREHLLPFFDKRHHVRVFHSERRYLTGEFKKDVQKLTRRYETEITKILENGVKSGDLRSDLDCELATLSLLGMCNSVADWYDGQSEKRIAEIADAYADVFVTGVAKQASPKKR